MDAPDSIENAQQTSRLDENLLNSTSSQSNENLPNLTLSQSNENLSNALAPQSNEFLPNLPAIKTKLSANEKREKIQNIKRGFGPGDFIAREVNPKTHPGAFWQKGLLLIFDRNEQKVDDFVYCKICDDVFYANPGNGSAPFNRHITKNHVEAETMTVTVSSLQLAEAIHGIMDIAIRYNTVIDVEKLTSFVPKNW